MPDDKPQTMATALRHHPVLLGLSLVTWALLLAASLRDGTAYRWALFGVLTLCYATLWVLLLRGPGVGRRRR